MIVSGRVDVKNHIKLCYMPHPLKLQDAVILRPVFRFDDTKNPYFPRDFWLHSRRGKWPMTFGMLNETRCRRFFDGWLEQKFRKGSNHPLLHVGCTWRIIPFSKWLTNHG